MRRLIAGIAALACIAGAAVTFLWQGVMYLQNSAWPKLSVATALRWLDGRSWARLAHGWPGGYALLDATPLWVALLGLALLGYALMKWRSER